MKFRSFLKISVLSLATFVMPRVTLGCAACYGTVDAPMSRGMNAGILSLLAVLLAVLSGFVAFIFYLRKRAAQTAQ